MFRWILLLLIFCSPASYATNKTLLFSHACDKGKQLRIVAVGDVLLHAPLQIKASKVGFTTMWEVALPYIQSADIAYANLEGPMAEGISRSGRKISDSGRVYDSQVYTSFPLFNYHPDLAVALKKSKFDIVSTANNHALDRYAIGVDKTIDELNQVGVKYVGTRKRNSDRPWLTQIDKNGFAIGWIACAETTNGIADKYKQVLYCFKSADRKKIISTISQMKGKLDAIIVSPHWGEEYNPRPNRTQQAFAKQVLDAGATAVIGSHPHVLQSMEKYITKDNRETFIIYSLGNFVSYQGSTRNRSTIILNLNLVKTSEGVMISGIQYVPMYMENRHGLNNIRLTLLPQGSSSAALRIIKQVLPDGNAVYSLADFKEKSCQARY